MIVPRWSATIVEPQITRILSSLGVDEAELAEPHRAEGRLAKQAVPPAIHRALVHLRGELDRGAAALSDALETSGLPLTERVVEGAERTIQHRLERLERRIIAATKRSHVETMTQIATARGALFPLGKRQERALNIIPFLARHGGIIIERMTAGARAHARLLVGSGASSEAASERSHTTPRNSGGETTRSVSHAEPTRTADA
jgi:bacillithiol synthase